MQEMLDEQLKAGSGERRDIFTLLVKTLEDDKQDATLQDAFGSE